MVARRRKPRRAHQIYNYDRGSGWILTAVDNMDHDPDSSASYTVDLVLYYTDDERVETRSLTRYDYDTSDPIDATLTGLLDVGANLGNYPGEKPAADTDFADQPRSVRMQRHATDIYRSLGHARGMSETMAVRVAEAFGSTWGEKTDPETWSERVPNVGEGRAQNFVDALGTPNR